jgi:glyoxylase I family protein
MPSTAGASHVSFSVSDLSAAVKWFGNVFGAQVMMNEPGDERSAAVLTLPESDLLVGLTSFPDRAEHSFDPRHSGLDHFAFAVATEASLDEWVRHLDSLAIEHSDPIPVPPGAILNFKGPDGIAFALMWRRDQS